METFHDQIKASTDQAHREAEEAPFIDNLMGGRLTQAAYLAYLVALEPIYQQMETLLHERSSHPLIEHFDHRALDRAELIAMDIAALSESESDMKAEVIAPTVTEYMGRLTPEISNAALLAHHYIRYLGDLSGGQAIAKLVARHYGITADGLNFYNFEKIGDPVFYKKRYRDLLNLVQFTEEEKSDFLKEVSKLYVLSRKIFMDLGKLHLARESA